VQDIAASKIADRTRAVKGEEPLGTLEVAVGPEFGYLAWTGHIAQRLDVPAVAIVRFAWSRQALILCRV
jgi:hypothetical protein